MLPCRSIFALRVNRGLAVYNKLFTSDSNIAFTSSLFVKTENLYSESAMIQMRH